MNKVPISWIIDDPAPVISVYYEHAGKTHTNDGRPLVSTYPNEGLFEFCEIIEKYGIRGKFSVVPMPGNKGDIVGGLEGVSSEDMQEWLSCVKERVVPAFTVGPEMLTHHKAVDLSTGEALPMNERNWATEQDRTTLTPYIAKALSLLKEAGFDPIGVTSPWDFGLAVLDEYEHAISQAVAQVSGGQNAWYFLHCFENRPNVKPWVALEEEGRTLVAIPATIASDFQWQTIDCTRTDEAYVSEIADNMITADGADGAILRALDAGCYPILVTHWQSLMSNGLRTGLRVMAEVGRRVATHLSDRVEWMSFEQITDLVVANKTDYPKPEL